MKGNVKTLKLLIKGEIARINELLDCEEISQSSRNYNNPIKSELKSKMRELRRDTKKLEETIYSYEFNEED